MRCPICRAEVSPDSKEMPFCSERCRMVDLGNWATEKYVIPAPVDDSDDMEVPDRLEPLQ